MKSLKSLVVLLALLATLLGSYLIGGPALHGQSALPVLHQNSVHGLLAGGSSAGGSNGGDDW